MEFVYALINVLLLAGLLILFARKPVARMFSRRRERINRELDEADRILQEQVKLPELPPEGAGEPGPAAEEEIHRIAAEAGDEVARIAARHKNDCMELRRELVSQSREELIEKLKKRVLELLACEPYATRLREHEYLFTERIVSCIALTPGDMSYLNTHDVLYVTLTSAHELPPEVVDLVKTKVQALLDKVGGKPSLWVRVDPTLVGGLTLRIGDTIYDCSVSGSIYYLDRALRKRQIRGDETPQALLADLMEGVLSREVKIHQFQLGRVISISDGICWMDGLSDIMYGEVVEFDCGERGMVLDIEPDRIGCVIYDKYEHIESGSRVRRVGRIASVPVGDELLGRVVDPLGTPLDGKGRIWTTERRPIECRAPGIPDRTAVSVPLHTGIKAIDALVPIGRGQRELIIGDRQTGKTSIAIDAIINQKGKNVVCIYVAIGQKETTVADVCAKLEKYGAMEYTTIVCATASSSASLQYIAPFAGTALGEHFMYAGRDVLIVYDDLSKHAVAYRELSLLLHRPSGREAYPGDVFYLHARLLERSARLSPEAGGGSMTALPIIETQAGDISAYIPTNVISITDGQIFLETDLFNDGQRPAVNVGLSVSRVGSAAQTKLMKQVSASLRMKLAQYRELASFAQFGSELDDNTRSVLDAGERMMAALRQGRYAPLPDWKQALLIFAVSEGFANRIQPDRIEEYGDHLFDYFTATHPELVKQLMSGAKMSPDTMEAVRAAIGEAV